MSSFSTDPLSDVLALLKPRSYVSVGLDAGLDWAIDFPPPEGIKFNAVLSGTCWLELNGAEPILLEKGDCFLLTQGRPFRMMSDRSLPTIPANDIYAHAKDGVAICNGGGEFFLVGSRFAFSGAGSDLLVSILPPVVHIREKSDQASILRFAIDQMARELREQHPGGFLMAEHLAHIMLMQILRLYLTAPNTQATGWLFALADRQIGKAIVAMHAEPARRWTLQQLAGITGMSRSSFAERFKKKVGAAPMDYLTRWRMMLACDRLANESGPISTIALSLGYESEAAFSTAFRRVMARSPRQYARVQHSRRNR
ncbi:AraC family transcriptional regulator [Rhizobium esperanzae]|uniref:AraC family transcriptional regulator n=1 Tax=Rhizobium esperanzae TaxID=1967781 RepID=A0A246DPR9_9HYPH|nr:AraC family transcriptional regulator [Rhizobium esperanzae]OWO92267.1 AraC family transcriptional regulator [Rhizobium esperanzae]